MLFKKSFAVLLLSMFFCSPARAALPENAAAVSERRVIRDSPGGSPRAQYEFVCEGPEGEGVRIYVDAATGRQSEIAV